MKDYSKLVNYLGEYNIDLSEEQIQMFDKYYEMLVEKNKVMNLTAITEFDEVLVKHFIDSTSIAMLNCLSDGSRVLDLGTGAGFPGIPLAIIYPNVNFVLVDSLNKRIKFLDEVINSIGLKNVSTHHYRAEEAARVKDFRENFDFVVSRAVANISTLSEYCLPFVKIGGQFISYKSGQIEDEITASGKAIDKLGGKINNINKFSIDNEMDRSFVIIDKIKTTPKTYPRKAGTPSKEPLS